MATFNKIIVFYDGGCSVCNKEINHYRRCDRYMQFDWVDIQAGSDWLKQLGISHAEAMHELHVLRADGVVVKGAAAFACIWSKLPRYSIFGKLIYRLHMISIANWFYRRFANWHYKNRCAQI